MKKLDNVTLCIVDCINYGEAISAIKKSQYQIEFAKTLFFTDINAQSTKFSFQIIPIDKIGSKAEYSHFIMKYLPKYIDTEYALIIQHDGYVLNGDSWDESFLDYDYTGAAWLEQDGFNIGNGGFSLRSKRLLDAVAHDDFIQMNHTAEDVLICRIYRPYLESRYGIKFANEEIADKFSFELREPICSTFGFHGKFHQPYKETVIIRRSGALGDCVALEPLLEHYYKNGYRVAIDIPLNLAMIYANHHYPVYHISQLNDTRVPKKVIDLDMSYENNPKQLHLKSYFETAGIAEYEIKNPKLNMPVTESTKLFRKYIVIHADIRDQPHRNIYGIDWQTVVAYLNDKEYTVIQIGQREHEPIKGAIFYNTFNATMLLHLIGGADLFCGIDSGPSNLAVACNIPSVIFFGSVKPEYIIPDLSNVKVIQNECIHQGCWHEVKGVSGQDCVFDVEQPPCTKFTTQQLFAALKELI